MTSKQIRQQFLDFFASKGHAIVESSLVVPPADDPSLKDTFTNAGMNQFKDVFLGTGSRSYNRAADTQKCIRAGGKHNDLDDVGQDTYHHTFFEMLGNWSFGDYFKKEAIEWAWELLTDVWGIDKDRLHVTYFEGDKADGLEPDTEAAQLWRTVTDIDPSHIHPGNKKDNFWEMGDTGPCGPCSEIHIDLTPDKTGGPLVNAGDPRVIELWNLVFIQYSRAGDGKLTPLPAKHIDTGMGFERLCAVLQGMVADRISQVSNYDTDVFMPIFEAIKKRTGAPAYRGTLPSNQNRDGGESGHEGTKGRRHEGEENQSPERKRRVALDQIMTDVSYRVIADHLRCLTFAITDGAYPSNEGRGYVLRRILRRAMHYGGQYFDMHEPFLCDLVEPLVAHMADAFPELRTAHGGKNVQHIQELIRDEETSFLRTLNRGLELFDAAARNSIATAIIDPNLPLGHSAIVGSLDPTTGESVVYGDRDVIIKASAEHDRPHDIVIPSDVNGQRQVIERYCRPRPIISGKDAFTLHDTYGVPIDLTELMAAERGLTVDLGEFEQLMEEARDRARKASAKLDLLSEVLSIPKEHLTSATDDRPKYETDSIDAEYLFVTGFHDEEEVDYWVGRGLLGLVFDRTCFYAEQGGQVGDQGYIQFPNIPALRVATTKHSGNLVIHMVDTSLVSPSQSLQFGQIARLSIDVKARDQTKKNHTSTHLLNWALREVLGDHVQQKGSLVDPEKTRFDFSHNKPVTDDELGRVESLVNAKIEAKYTVYTKEVDQKKAREINTLRAVFGEKYPDRVRVVSIGADIDAMLKDPTNRDWLKYSVEFCGGTHLRNSGEAECFVLTAEEAVAKGIRRLVGVTGETAREAIATGKELLAEAETLEGGRDGGTEGRRDEGKGDPSPDRKRPVLTSTHSDLTTAVAAFQQKVNEAVIPVGAAHRLRSLIAGLQQKAKDQQKQAASVSADAVMEMVKALLASGETVEGVTIVVGEVPAAGADALRGAIDWERNTTEASAVLLATSSDDKVTLVAGMSKAVVKKGVKAGDLIKEIAPLVGGRGGGRPDMAQGGGGNIDGIAAAIARAEAWIREKLS